MNISLEARNHVVLRSHRQVQMVDSMNALRPFSVRYRECELSRTSLLSCSEPAFPEGLMWQDLYIFSPRVGKTEEDKNE